MSARFAPLLLLAFAQAIACNSYNPNLGGAPYRCGTDRPRCPSGYACVTYSATDEVCELVEDESKVPDAAPPADAAPLVCNNDSDLEPNNSLSDPTVTSIPVIDNSYSVVAAICPSNDEDFYRFVVDATGKSARIEVTYQSGRGTLLLDIRNDNGASIQEATPMDGTNGNVLVAEATGLVEGRYYAHVRSTGAKNNYSIKIAIE